MKLQQNQLDSIRLQLLETAQFRPGDIESYYKQHLLKVNGCWLLGTDAPRHISMLYRGKLRHYDPSVVTFALAGKDPYGERTCGIANCLNPDHVVN